MATDLEEALAEAQEEAARWKDKYYKLATGDLPAKQQDALGRVTSAGESGYTVRELVEERSISYPAAFKLLRKLAELELVVIIQDSKGHSQRYFLPEYVKKQ